MNSLSVSKNQKMKDKWRRVMLMRHHRPAIITLFIQTGERNYVNVHVCLQQQRSAPGVHLFLYMSTQSQHRRFLMHCRETAGLKCRSFYPSLNQIVKVSDLLQRTAGAFLPTPPVSQRWREHTSLNSSNRSCQATPTSHESQRRPEYKMWN